MPFIYALHERALCTCIPAGLMERFLKSRIPKWPLKRRFRQSLFCQATHRLSYCLPILGFASKDQKTGDSIITTNNRTKEKRGRDFSRGRCMSQGASRQEPSSQRSGQLPSRPSLQISLCHSPLMYGFHQ